MKIMRFIGIVFALFSAGSPSDTSAQDSGKKYKVYMVSNSHLDTQWRWDVKATIDDYLYNTAVQNLALLEKYPHYVFNFEGAVKYEWIKEYYKKEFGIKSKDMFLPDCFGFSQVMPTLGHHCGLIGFSTQKLSWRTEPLVGDSKTPFPIGLWEGVDGARIMVALEPGRYSWNEFPEGDLSANEELAERRLPGTLATNWQTEPETTAARPCPAASSCSRRGLRTARGPCSLSAPRPRSSTRIICPTGTIRNSRCSSGRCLSTSTLRAVIPPRPR